MRAPRWQSEVTPGDLVLELPGRPLVFRWIPGSAPGGFWLAETPLTQGQWEALGEGRPPGQFRGCDLPVECVDWPTATVVCDRIGVRLGQRGGLPTSAGWEYAARAGGPADPPQPLDEHAWHAGNSGGSPRPVGLLRANPWGLYDMLGNLWEWCSDWAVTDPPQQKLCVRGGSWSIPPQHCRADRAGGDPPTNRLPNLGFRPALFPC